MINEKIKSFDDFFTCANEVTYYRRLREFAEQSNAIECINDVVQHEIMAVKLEAFLKLKKLNVENVCEFNDWGALRDKEGMNVSVGGDLRPYGGEYIRKELGLILLRAMNGSGIFRQPFCIHKTFEELHPFMDGNGRAGRAIWLWQMVNQHNYDLSRGFLHEWYYQSLSNLGHIDDWNGFNEGLSW